MSDQKVKNLGVILAPKFYEPLFSETEKNNILVNELGLKTERFTLLLSTGGAGANNHVAFLKELVVLKDYLQVIALCGSNQSAMEEVKIWSQQNSYFNVCALSFTDKMHQIIQISDAVVGRAGRLPYEALHLGCPVIFNGLGGIMPQELLTVGWFKSRDMSTTVYTPKQLLFVCKKWILQPEIHSGIRKKLLSYRRDFNTDAFIREVLNVSSQ